MAAAATGASVLWPPVASDEVTSSELLMAEASSLSVVEGAAAEDSS